VSPGTGDGTLSLWERAGVRETGVTSFHDLRMSVACNQPVRCCRTGLERGADVPRADCGAAPDASFHEPEELRARREPGGI